VIGCVASDVATFIGAYLFGGEEHSSPAPLTGCILRLLQRWQPREMVPLSIPTKTVLRWEQVAFELLPQN